MRDMLRSTFTWRLLGGFALGTAGLVAVHAATAAGTLADHIAPPAHVAR